VSQAFSRKVERSHLAISCSKMGDGRKRVALQAELAASTSLQAACRSVKMVKTADLRDRDHSGAIPAAALSLVPASLSPATSADESCDR
jgi:hypothetical protein